MIRRLSTLAFLVLAVTGLATAQVSAQQSVPMTNEHIQRIKDNCQAANWTLRQLRASDALLRVNRGQLYDLISTKLMARLNSRLAINRLDASKLVSVTVGFDRSLTDFRSHYQVYGEQLVATLKIDCEAKPVDFYNSVKKAREYREQVNKDVHDLAKYINEYSQEFDIFRSQFLQNQSQGDKS